jgi:hypothetical protein
MGGQINMAFRFADGEACCFDRWTNNVWPLADLRVLDGDETPVREYIAMTRNNDFTVDPYYNGRPVRLSTSNYGLILIDFVSKTIIDVNGYTTLFGAYHSFELRKPTGNDNPYFSRRYILVRDALASGRGVIRQHWPKGSDRHTVPTVERLTGIESMARIDQDADDDRRDNGYALFSIDVAPWRYVNGLGDDPKERREALKIAREIGFPFTRKEGLNANFPPPRANRKATKDEVKARYLWMRMKEREEYAKFDGVPFDRLSKESRAEMLKLGSEFTDQQFQNAQLSDFVGATTMKVTISL